MTFKFEPDRPSPLKDMAWEKIKDNKQALLFLEWCQHLVIVSKDEGEMSFTPNLWLGSQWMFVAILFSVPDNVRYLFVLKSRQLGITTICNAYDLYYNFKNKNALTALISADYKISEGMRNNLRTMYDNLPLKARIIKKNDNAYMMAFKNGSSLKYLFTTSRKSQKGNMGRSGANQYGHFTEVAFFQNTDDLNAFMATLSDVHPERFYIFESTANSYNHYFDMWEAAKDSHTMTTLFVGFWANENYSLDDPIDIERYSYPMEQWEQESWDLVKEMYGYEIGINQIAWWRKVLKEKMQDRGGLTREDMMLQEYPWHEHDCWRLSGKSFFNRSQVRALENLASKPIVREEPIMRAEIERIEFKNSPVGKIQVWERWEEQPDNGVVYIVGADPSWGANPDSDNGVITIYKCFKDCIEQVLEYSDNFIDTKAYAWILLSLVGQYNASYILEVPGPGKAVLQLIDLYRRWIRENKIDATMTIYDYAKKYMKEYLYKRVDSFGSPGARHWITTGESKEQMLFNFQTCVNNGEVIIRSKELVSEIGYIVKENGTIAASGTKHDDRVIASALVCQHWVESYRSRLKTKADYLAEKAVHAEQQAMYRDRPAEAFGQHFVREMVLGGVYKKSA
jgi:hypothetical protein